MRALKTLLIIVLTLTGIIALLIALGPQQGVVERSLTVAASPQQLLARARTTAQLDAWAPWRFFDPTLRIVALDTTADGSERSQLSGRRLGSTIRSLTTAADGGPIVISETEQGLFGTQVKHELRIEAAPEGSTVKWTSSAVHDGIDRLRALLMPAEHFWGAAVDSALGHLSVLLQDSLPLVPDEVHTADLGVAVPATVLVGKRLWVQRSRLEEFKGFAGERTAGILSAAGIPITGPLWAVQFGADGNGQRLDMFWGYPVDAPNDLRVAGRDVWVMPADTVEVITVEGAVGAIQAKWQELKAERPDLAWPRVMEYSEGADRTSDTSAWRTRLFVPLERP